MGGREKGKKSILTGVEEVSTFPELSKKGIRTHQSPTHIII